MSDSPLSRRNFIRGGASGLGLKTMTFTSSPAEVEGAERLVDFDVRLWGARGDGSTFDTAAIQAAIDACATAKGGRVVIAGGTFLTRTLQLKSNVTLYLEAGSVLQGTSNLKDYSEIVPKYACYTYSNRSFLFAENAENISILGKGTIDLQGRSFPPQQKHTDHKAGVLEWGESPLGVRLVQCKGVTLRDVTIRNCPMAALRLEGSSAVVIHGLTIDNRVRISCDGIELVSCQNVSVSDCHVDSWDDAICIKSASLDVCRNIAITNCTIGSLCNAIKLGTESNGGFENIAISNCTIQGHESNGWTSINGLALMIVDGGLMNGISVTNLVMRHVRTAIFIHLGDRARPFSTEVPVLGIGRLQNILISNVTAEVVDREICCSITGLPGHPVQDVVLDNIRIYSPGGRTEISARRVLAEKPKDYPESLMFGPLPAHGFYCRHVKGLTLRNVSLHLDLPDVRPAIFCTDVSNLCLSGIEAETSGDGALIQLQDVSEALVQACRPRAKSFLMVEGELSAKIAILANDLRHVIIPVSKGSGFTGDVQHAGNLNQA